MKLKLASLLFLLPCFALAQQQALDLGTGADDDGEFLSTAGPKIEGNFDELYDDLHTPLVACDEGETLVNASDIVGCVAVGTSGHVLTSAGAGMPPTFQAVPASLPTVNHYTDTTAASTCDASEDILTVASIAVTTGDFIFASYMYVGTKGGTGGDVQFILEYGATQTDLIDWIVNQQSINEELYDIANGEVIRYHAATTGVATGNGTVTIDLRCASEGSDTATNEAQMRITVLHL